VEDAFPVMEVLFAERGVESVGVTVAADVRLGRAFAEHLLMGLRGRGGLGGRPGLRPADYWDGIEGRVGEGVSGPVPVAVA